MLVLLALVLAAADVSFVELPGIPADAFYRPADSTLCVKLTGCDSVVVLDCRTLAIRCVVPFPSVRWGCFDSVTDRIYAGEPDGLVVTGCRTWQVQSRPRLAQAWLCAPWVSPTQGRVYAPFSRDSAVLLAVYDARSDTFASVLTLARDFPGWSCRFAEYPSRGRVYCSQYPRGRVTTIDVAANRIIRHIANVVMPTTLLCDPDADKVYCLNDGDGSISVIDAAHDSVVAVFEPGRWTGSAALAGQGRLLVSLDDIGTPIRTTPTSEHGLVVVDMARCTVVRVIDSTVTPARLVRDEQRRLSYGLCTSEPGSSGGSSVVVVDCRTDRLLQRLNVGGTPHSVVVDPISGRAFVLFADRPHIAVLPKPSR